MTGRNSSGSAINAQVALCVRDLVHLMRPAILSVVVLAVVLGVVGISHAQGFSVAYGNKEFMASAGDRFSGVIEVTNLSEEELTFSASIQDYVRVDGGKGGYQTDEPGTDDKSLSSWMTFSPDQMVLGPGETGLINYDVNVPVDDSLDGSYWGVLLVQRAHGEESIAERVESAPSGNVPTVGIRVVFEYAIIVYLTMEGTERREAVFSAIRVDEADGGHAAVATFNNIGNIYMKPDVWLELTDTSGQMVYKSEPQERVVLPESEREFSFSLKEAGVSPGEYLLMIIADYDVPQLIAAQARINITESEPAAAADDSQVPADDAGGGETETDGDGSGGAAETQPPPTG